MASKWTVGGYNDGSGALAFGLVKVVTERPSPSEFHPPTITP